MRAFIKSQDEKAWRSILLGWTPPIEKDDKGNSKVKSELEWSIEDEKLSGYNNKGLHAIFNGVGEGFIKLISSCKSVKEAWKILQTQFEGTTDVKRSRFTMLQTRFDELRMLETETLSQFYEKLFDTKLLAMKEAKDFGKMKVEELMGSLRTFELNQQIKQKGKSNPSIEKNKGIAFKVSKIDVSDDEKDDEMALLTRNFQKFMKKNKKGFNVTWSDDDSESSEKENEKVALTSVLSSAFQERGKILCLKNTLTDVDKKEIDSDSDKSKRNDESLAESYKDILIQLYSVVFTVERSVSTEMKQSGKPENSHGKKKRFIPSCQFCGVKGDKDFLVNIRPMQCGEVTFGNGLAGNVIGMGTLNFEGLPRLKNVMLVEGLRVNLLSVSQICDQGYTVNFDSNRCYVVNDQDEIILQGFGSNDNCYTLTTYATCHSAIDNSTDLWHEKLGHIHFKNLKKLSNAGIIRALPKLGKESVGKCEPCQLGKKLKISHKSIPDANTSKVLELLHMDLMDCNIGKIVRIWSDHGKEFENTVYDEFCKSKGYSINSRAYRVYNMRTQTVMKFANVVVDDLKDFSEFSTKEHIESLLEKSPELVDDLAAIT
ncbi:uncharacterized protein LOC133812992 [Humulus lupulus]|uniref:uncharacterized protein LOC133812992 n=1 Tax=Humulus lupulus TaxID=3486 RepID=UPI002B408A29|nr:uncharacterized protein LOC133812992 [Humulus lupulus]